MEKSSVEQNNYDITPIYDAHIHTYVSRPLDETVWFIKNAMKHFNHKKIMYNALPTYNISDNWVAFYCKANIPDTYVNAGFCHPKNCDDADYFYNQVKAYYEMGCDGIKMIEGKPDSRKELGLELDCEAYCRAYKYMEDNGIPLLIHVNDPKPFWDIKSASEIAIKNGWVYGDSFPSYEKIRSEAERIADKFPDLKIVFAHFFFVSDDLEYADKFLSKHKNVCFDITPGTEMFSEFDKNYKRSREFFIKYSDRILYGTDMDNSQKQGEMFEQSSSWAVNLVRPFLEGDQPFTYSCLNIKYNHPLALGKEELDNIYRNNFVRIFGEKPRALDKDRIVSGIKEYMSVNASKYFIKPEPTAVDVENIIKITEEFRNH